MTTSHRGARIARRLAGGTAAAAFVTLAMASSAVASPFSTEATALAAAIRPPASAQVDTGVRTATNDGSTAQVTDGNAPPLSVLGTQSILTNAVLGQTAVARNDGTSQACAGASDGAIDITDFSNCINDGENFLTITLTNNVTITARKIQETCDASPGVVAPAAAASFVSAVINDGANSFGIPDSPAANTDLVALLPASMHDDVAAIGSFELNPQSTGTDSIAGAALRITSNEAANVVIGSVSCGPAVDAPNTPMIPAAGVPTALAAGGALLLGVLVYRRRRAHGEV
jgi:hypothetical protein